ncbi:MAG: hypothetical protein IJ243_03835 [Prevotella sp.]|nr:hypothetical protein [Prevotella sp.]
MAYQASLDAEFAGRWSAEELSKANTAASATYLSKVEKEVFFYLNLARMNPSLFAETYARSYSGILGWNNGYAFDERKQSLIAELQKMSPLPVLSPNEVLFGSADCYATNGGNMGVTGHDRTDTGCSENPGLAECAAFGGYVTGLSVVMELLIDSGENNAALGHRRILLNGNYEWLGVAVRAHKDFYFMVVMDLDSRNL